MSQEAATDAPNAADEEVEETGPDGTAFDPERAKHTIAEQRKAEKALKAQLKEMQDKLAGYTAAEEAKLEAEKALEVKLQEREKENETLQNQIATLHVKQDFVAKAVSKGVADPELAFLAAKEQGYLGSYNPKEGNVGEHDWEALGAKYPSFQTDVRPANSGEAGATGRGKVTTTSSAFNDTVRSAIRR